MRPRRPQFGQVRVFLIGVAPTLADVTNPGDIGRLPFRASSVIAAGKLTRDDLKSDTWRRLLRDVYVDGRVPITQRVRIQAAALRLPPGGVIAGRSAAFLWGADLNDLGDRIEVLSPTRIRANRDLVVHTGSIDPTEVTSCWGVAVPTPLHTGWQMGCWLPIAEAVPWIDALARARRLDTPALLEHAAEHRHEYGNLKATQTLALCDRRAESPPESTVRLRLVLAGVPAPIPQFRVFYQGEFVARVDLAWPWLKLAVEYDGQWHADRDQLARDRERIRNLNAAGWYVFPVTRNDLPDLDGLVRTIAALIAQRSRIL